MKAIHLFGGVLLAFILIRSEARGLEPLYDGLGSCTRKISTKSPKAQKYFDQGLNFYFGFNHGAALRGVSSRANDRPGLCHELLGGGTGLRGRYQFPGRAAGDG